MYVGGVDKLDHATMCGRQRTP